MSMEYVVKGKISLSIHDLKCATCGHELKDVAINTDKVDKEQCVVCCGYNMHIRWDISERRANVTIDPNITPRDRAIVYIDPRTGKSAIPGKDTEFTRRKYESWGYQRKEFETLRELDRFCKKEKLVNEKSNFNNGNGIN